MTGFHATQWAGQRPAVQIAVLLMVVLHACVGVAADKPEKPLPAERFEPALLPVVGGNSDMGFQFGILAVLARFEGDYDPYKWRLQLLLDTSVKQIEGETAFPTHEYVLEGDFPGLWGDKLRIGTYTGFLRKINRGYYGLGNASSVDGADVEHLNAYKTNEGVARITGRIVSGKHLEIALGFTARYLWPDFYEGSKLDEDKDVTDEEGNPIVHGTEDHFSLILLSGIVFDNRDHETAPTKGMHHELGFRYSPGFATDFWHTGATLHTRFFFPLAKDYLVLGARLAGDLLGGSPPVYLMGEMGTVKQFGIWGPFGVRGVPSDRFLGKIRIMGALELRSMFLKFNIKSQRFRVGMVAFFDTGRVWTDYETNEELDGTGAGLKFGTGGGLRVQWGETVMVRADFAYSPEIAKLNPDFPVGIYIDLGQAF